MALEVGTNSWIDLANADIYFSERLNSSDWDDLDDADKTKALITAFRWVIYDPMFLVPASADSEEVKAGQCEAAIFLVTYGDEYEKRSALISSGVTHFEYSKWREDLGEVVKPSGIINIFAKAGYYNGGVGMTILSDPATET